MVKINKNLVSSSIVSSVTYGGTNTKQYIVIHETANTSKGANADAHGRLQANGNSRSASWHYTVDDKEIVQSFSDNAQCWHAGNASYNRNSIGIEICVNSDGNYKKAVDNAIELTKQLMKKYNIPASNVIQHNTASGKDCPRYLRAGNKGITWSQFKSRLGNTSTSSNKTTSKPKKSTSKSSKANYNTKSIVNFLQSINQPWSLNHRKKLAGYYGIKSYSGQAVKNLQLLDLLQKDYKANGKLKTKKSVTTSKPKSTTASNSKKYPLPTGVLRRGSRGNGVKQLQRALNKANFKVGTVDGIYGKKTEDAVRRFQSVYDAYNVDGIYGSRTRTRLDKQVN